MEKQIMPPKKFIMTYMIHEKIKISLIQRQKKLLKKVKESLQCDDK
jgi:hypothetical protein